MKLLIDDANINEIERLCDLYPIDGVTTNPSILAKNGNDPVDTLCRIRKLIGKDKLLFVQTIPSNSEGIVEDAKAIVSLLGKDTVVKIPAAPEGFKAMKQLKKEGVTTCGTAVYAPMQAYLAMKSGASYIAPYVNRIDSMGYGGIETVRKMQDIIDSYGYECEILAASFRNSQQVLELCEYGIAAATCSPSVIDGLCRNASIDQAVENFHEEFEKAFGKGCTMKSLIKNK